MIYPAADGALLETDELRARYPETWQYLASRRDVLEAQKSSKRKGPGYWWRPLWPRDPKHLLSPKIVCPHLMLTPRFALDLKGEYVVSHAPYLTNKIPTRDDARLKYFCAILNSSVAQWWISRNAPKYGGGYSRIEVSLLKRLPVPDPVEIGSIKFNEIVSLVDEMRKSAHPAVDVQLDELVAELYGLDRGQFKLLSGSQFDA